MRSVPGVIAFDPRKGGGKGCEQIEDCDGHNYRVIHHYVGIKQEITDAHTYKIKLDEYGLESAF